MVLAAGDCLKGSPGTEQWTRQSRQRLSLSRVLRFLYPLSAAATRSPPLRAVIWDTENFIFPEIQCFQKWFRIMRSAQSRLLFTGRQVLCKTHAVGSQI